MSGLNCAIQLQRALSAVPAVKGGSVSIGGATVEYENASDEQLLQAVCAAGNYEGKIITSPASRGISKLNAWVRKVNKGTAGKENLDSTVFTSNVAGPRNENAVRVFLTAFWCRAEGAMRRLF